MSYISNQKNYPSNKPNAKLVFLLCGYGGKIWQLSRLIGVLNKDGYDVIAFDFSKSVLSSGDHIELLKLTDEVVNRLSQLQEGDGRPALLVGVSLGALLSLNVLRESADFQDAILITGGDIAKIARKLFPKVWKQSESELKELWKNINMYSDPELLRGKRALFVLHPSSKLIDVEDTYREIEYLQKSGIAITLVKRSRFDHIGTIIEETIFFPRRLLIYIRKMQAN